MINRIYQVIILVTFNVSVFSQGWFINTTFNPAQSLQTIRFWDANTGYTTAPLYNGSNFCIHKTTNAGQNWSDQNSGYTSMRFMAIWIVHPDTVYMSGNNGLIIKTVNGGLNWVTLPTGNTDQLWGMQFVNSQTGYVCGSAGRILKTTNAGVNWVNQTAGVQNAFSNMHFRNETTGYISGGSLIVKTTNGGTNWFSLSAPYISFENIRDITFINDTDGFAVSDAGRMYRTTNSGTNWQLIPSGTSESLFGIFFTDPNTAYSCGNNGAIVKTTNAGGNWTGQISPLSEILTDVWFTGTNTGYISTWSGKVLKTTNGGVTFINQIGTEVPESFSLGQNYPNPFNPATSIKFQIPESGYVELSVFDALGRKITGLIKENLQAGIYEIDWISENNPSGVYLYKLITNDFSDTKKMILVK